MQFGEFSAGRQTLEASLATEAPFRATGAVPRRFVWEVGFGSGHVRQKFEGVSPRLCMTTNHFRPLLDSVEDTTRFWRFSQDLARAEVPEEIVEAIRLGHKKNQWRVELFLAMFVVLWSGSSFN